MDPLSVLLLGTCMVACWPCLLPCCLALPIVPFPLIIVKERKPHSPHCKPKDVAGPYRADSGTKVDTKLYYVCVTNSGVVLKRNKYYKPCSNE